MLSLKASDHASMHGHVKPLVFYDGSCSLCRSETAHYRRIDRENRLDRVNISRETELVEGGHPSGLSPSSV